MTADDRSIPEEWIDAGAVALNPSAFGPPWVVDTPERDRQRAEQGRQRAMARAVLAAVVPLVEAKYEWAQELTPAEDCPLELHAQWFVAGDATPSCPGCEADRQRNEIARLRSLLPATSAEQPTTLVSDDFDYIIDPVEQPDATAKCEHEGEHITAPRCIVEDCGIALTDNEMNGFCEDHAPTETP